MSPPEDPERDCGELPAATPRKVVSTVLRLLVGVAALAVSFVVLGAAFEELDVTEIRSALASLGDAELVAIAAMWCVWIASQGLQTAALVDGLPVRRGVVAFLGPTAVASMIPGPSDLPVRYRMFTSWGYSPVQAGLAITAGGIFSIGMKLVLPVVAAIGLLASGAPLDGTARTVVTAALVVGLGSAIVIVVLGSEQRTAAVGRWLHPLWAVTTRVLRRQDDSRLSDRLVSARTEALAILRGKWLMASWGTTLSAVTNLGLLLMCLRFMDVPADAVSWQQVFVVFALVQGLTVIPLTAGNAGVSELAYVGLLAAAAGPVLVNEVAAGVILYRLLTWIMLIPVGVAALGVWRMGARGLWREP